MTRLDLTTWAPDPLDRGTALHDANGAPILLSQQDAIALLPTSMYVAPNGYVFVRIGGKKTMLHRHILGVMDPDIHVDHRNRKRWDCRRSNLRLATLAQNNRNGSLRRNNTSGYKGVSWDRSRGLWQAGIGVAGRRKALGRFTDPVAAAKAYDAAARHHYGEFASLNFPEA